MSGKQLTMCCINEQCPDFTRQQRKRLWVRLEENTGYCYRCARLFDVPKFVMHFERCTFRQAMTIVQKYASDEPVSGSMLGVAARLSQRKKVAVQHPLVELPEGFRKIERTTYPRYLQERGLPLKDAIKFDMGYCLSGRYANRLVIPVYFENRLVSWVGRAMWKVPKNAEGMRGKKVVNAPGTSMGRFLFNYDRAKNASTLVITEGPFDAIAMGDCAVALFGTHLSHEQYGLLLKTKARKVVVLLDPDDAGRSASTKIVERLRPMFDEVSAPEIATDPDELSPTEQRRVLRAPAKNSLVASVAARLR
jgi:DNA primase